MVLFWSVFFTTFIVEDWAIAGSLVLVSQGKMTWPVAYWAAFLGISLGDILLYFLGRFANVSARLHNSALLTRVRKAFDRPQNRKKINYAIVLSRAVPGTRFVTYVGAGLVSYPAWQFLLLTPITVGAWVLIAFAGGRSLQKLVSDHWFLGLIVIFVALAILRHWIPLLTDPWKRKTLPHFWRRWLIFEFWPAWFAYAPIVPYYIYLSIKHGSLFHPFYANPNILNGGLIGEAKWEILQYLDPKDPSTLKTIKILAGTSLEDVKVLLNLHDYKIPLIAKPNVGQRGFAVRIIKSAWDLEDYVAKADFDFLIQEKSRYEKEAGVFYIRDPITNSGDVCSITDKNFPFVVGDGKTKLGDLILQDPRARIMALLYFHRHASALDHIVAAGDKFFISECGNHCQGAIFLDGQHLRTEALRRRFDEIARHLPNFYFGRFDIRYENQKALMDGERFEIVEVNGAGADITHIYDQRTKIVEAYRVMFSQWRMLFETGKAARRKHGRDARVNICAFLKECVRVNLRNSDLSVSS